MEKITSVFQAVIYSGTFLSSIIFFLNSRIHDNQEKINQSLLRCIEKNDDFLEYLLDRKFGKEKEHTVKELIIFESSIYTPYKNEIDPVFDKVESIIEKQKKLISEYKEQKNSCNYISDFYSEICVKISVAIKNYRKI